MADVPGNSSTSASIGIGGSAYGELEAVGDHDWYRIELSAGQSINVVLDGLSLGDAYLRIRDSAGNVLFENDDIKPGTNLDSAVAFTASYTGTFFIDVAAFEDSEAGTYQLSVQPYTPPPLWSLDQIANQLTDGYWGGSSHHFAASQGGTITVNLTGLTAAGQNLAQEALALWSDVTGIRFTQVTTGGQILFDDDEAGAFSDGTWSGGIISAANVNVSVDWLNDYGTGLDSYSFQTYVHEIGHALGLGHAGNYNGDARYPFDALFANDSWATTVMSYFSQQESSHFAGQGFSYALVVTPMLADIVAMSRLYGLSTTTRTGDTVYGYNSNAGRDIFNAALYPQVAYTVFDSGGTDTLDFSRHGGPQRIDLNQESYSNVLGLIGNVSIARGTIIENAMSGTGDDVILGNAASNVLSGGGGRDLISYENALSGVRVDLRLTSQQDTGGAGRDTLSGFEELVGSSFNDTLVGAANTLSIHGGAGDDRITATASVNAYGDDGDDVFVVSLGNDYLVGGQGFDTADYSSASGGITVDTFGATNTTGSSGYDTLAQIERIIGSRFNDNLRAFNVGDVVIGASGDDLLQGSSYGDCELVGGAGNDVYSINSSANRIVERLSEGVDLVQSWATYTLSANIENLVLLGTVANNGTGNDGANSLTGNAADNRLAGAGGDDLLYGNAGNDTLDGGAGVDRLFGGLGNDTYVVRDATDYAYENGGEGVDQVYASVTHALRANLENLRLTGTAAIGGTGNDLANTVTGNGAANKLYGLAGDDRLYGANGNDTLTGGAGVDRLYGGTGDDYYYVSDATDYIYENASEGADRVYSSVSHALRANLEVLTLTGSAAINGTGNDLANTLVGNGAANVLKGLAGDDRIDGGAGDDWLEGGAGRDRLTGGSGADSFVFRDRDIQSDGIADFRAADGDRIRLDYLDANQGQAGNQAFSFLGTAAFTGVAGQLRYEQISGNTYLSGDTNGDGTADFTLRLDGLHTLGAGDLVL